MVKNTKIRMAISRKKPVGLRRKNHIRPFVMEKVLGQKGKKFLPFRANLLHTVSGKASIIARILKKELKRLYNMDIKQLNTYSAPHIERPQETFLRNKLEDNESENKTPMVTQDRVELSDKYQEMNRLTKVSMDREEIRTEVVDHYRNLLKNDAYSIDAEKIAEKMISELF
jgi:flagellar biosynthesis anti-sigma factor FlgM